MNKELYDLAEQVILDYTAASKWKQIERLKWTSAEVQELIVKGIEKVNGDSTSKEKALHKHIVSKAKRTYCNYSGTCINKETVHLCTKTFGKCDDQITK